MPCEERRPFIPEGSDTELIFHVTEETSCWEETDIDLSVYNSVVLKIKYANWEIVNYTGSVNQEHNYLVTFTILWESSVWRAWEFKAEIWWIKWAEKHRFNKNTFVWDVLASIEIPEWATANN